MGEWLRKLFGRQSTPVLNEPGAAEAQAGSDGADDLKWMFPPSTVKDPAAWDRYWHDQLTHGWTRFIDAFVDDGELVDVMRANGLKTVLCIGNGISQEPRALAWAGFDVTSLDLSPLATQVAIGDAPPEDLLETLVGGRSGGLNGRLEFVAGDLSDPAACPGPYDVVIERKTLQLWPEADRPLAMRAVANRLASRGVFFSHSHDGRWKPPAPPRHASERWFLTEGWEFWARKSPLTGRVAWLYTTTG